MIEETKKEDFQISIEEMAKAGLHFGRKTSKTHPHMRPYIYGVRNTISIIDLQKTKEKLIEALQFIKKLVREGKVILLVGTAFQHKELLKEIAQECGFPYINERWLGGTFTNFPVIKKRVDYLKELERKKEEGELEQYTKKERLKIDKEIDALKIKFDGLKPLEGLPDALFVINLQKDKLAAREARRKGVKVIAIVDADADPDLADYPIPANDAALSSVRYILEKVKEVVEEARGERLVAGEKGQEKPEKGSNNKNETENG